MDNTQSSVLCLFWNLATFPHKVTLIKDPLFRPEICRLVFHQTLLLLLSVEQPQSSKWSFLSLMVRAGYVCVAIIHWTLTWTTGCISCADVNACDCTQGCADTERESTLKVDSGKKSLAMQRKRTCISGMMVQCSLEPTKLHPIPTAVIKHETEIKQPLTHPLRSASGTCCPLLTSNNLMDRSEEHVASLVP